MGFFAAELDHGTLPTWQCPPPTAWSAEAIQDARRLFRAGVRKRCVSFARLGYFSAHGFAVYRMDPVDAAVWFCGLHLVHPRLCFFLQYSALHSKGDATQSPNWKNIEHNVPSLHQLCLKFSAYLDPQSHICCPILLCLFHLCIFVVRDELCEHSGCLDCSTCLFSVLVASISFSSQSGWLGHMRYRDDCYSPTTAFPRSLRAISMRHTYSPASTIRPSSRKPFVPITQGD